MANGKDQTDGLFVNVSFKNHPRLFEWLQREVASIPDMDRSTYMRRLVRREMARKLRRQAQQSPTEDDNTSRAVAA